MGIVHASWGQGLSLGAGAALLAVLTAVATGSLDPSGPGWTETARSRK